MAIFETLNIKINSEIEILFRPLFSTDAVNLINFKKQIATETTHTMYYVSHNEPRLVETEDRLQKQLNDKHVVNIGAFHNSTLVGYLNFRSIWQEHLWVAHIAQFGMMILKNYWNMGIGNNLLQIQEQHANKIGITRIEAMVRVSNERGITLYERNGYKIEGTRKNAALINNEFVDEYFIAKIINDSLNNWQPPVIETQRLVLRAITLSDASDIYAYAKNPNVSKYTLWEAHASITDSINYIKDYVFSYYRNGVPEPFGIALKSNPEKIIGTVGCFWVSKKNKSMELAYALSEEHWGQGITTEAAVEVMNYCFKKFDLKRIQAKCKVQNKASAKVMEKLEMKFEGTNTAVLFHRNEFCDTHTYAKVKQ